MTPDFWMALAGGALIGLAATVTLGGAGRIAGVSGICGGLLRSAAGDRAWRLAFLGGLLLGGILLQWVLPEAFALPEGRSLPAIAGAGLLVGVGVRMGSGCTSGHGVCGLSRFSPRSLAATLTFMAFGFALATLLQVLLQGRV